ncbi:MAG: bifunctional lysine ketoglutarate reductase /saccharopine dehydrogenase family protein [Desulfosarcinaceae bacterium]|nr:bifunctional lysine ketoglutarate reductase /saccharopine dehydrogenase family protein [Desulfosarcinaceae bacterium]
MKTLLIRAEDKNRWERRTALVPADLKKIREKTNVRAYVQVSAKRCFSSQAYLEAGAQICHNEAPGEVILGVKEIPEEKIQAGKTYLFFSHTIKGQQHGMPLLRKIIDSGATLIDYERISDEKGRRMVYFGRYAGDAGAIDILSLMGAHWAAKGVSTPLSQINRAHEYTSVADAQRHLKAVGAKIAERGFPDELTPFTIGVLGYGNVSEGAQQILDCLPTERVAPDEVETLTKDGTADPKRLYVTVFKEADLVERTDGGAFDLQEYFDQPDLYQSRFDPYLAHFRLLINAIYWEARYPRFITWEGLKRQAERSPKSLLAGIADITCDTHGSVECNVRSTDSDMPAYQVDPLTQAVTDGHTGDGIVLLAVDNLPCELPLDSSTFFSHQLSPLVPNILTANFDKPLEKSGLNHEVRKAVIVYNGQLTQEYAYLQEHLDAHAAGKEAPA